MSKNRCRNLTLDISPPSRPVRMVFVLFWHTECSLRRHCTRLPRSAQSPILGFGGWTVRALISPNAGGEPATRNFQHEDTKTMKDKKSHRYYALWFCVSSCSSCLRGKTTCLLLFLAALAKPARKRPGWNPALPNPHKPCDFETGRARCHPRRRGFARASRRIIVAIEIE